MTVGIDTLQLRLARWQVKKTAPLQVKPGVIDFQSGEVQNETPLFRPEGTGQPVMGTVAFYNDEFLTVEIKPMIIQSYKDKEEPEKIVSEKVPMMFVRLSLPRFFSEKNNVEALTVEQTCEAISKLQLTLESLGFSGDVLESKVARMDLFKNVEHNEPFFDYVPIFRALNAAKKKPSNPALTTYNWINKSTEQAAYDKRAEVLAKYGEDIITNLMRFEARFKRQQAAKRAFNLDELKIVDVLENPDKLKEVHRETFLKGIFKNEAKDMKYTPSNDLEETMKFFQENHGRNWHQKFKDYSYFNNLREKYGIEQYERVLDNVIQNERSRYRAKKEFRKALDLSNVPEHKKRQLGELYDELKTKTFQA